MAVGLLWGLMHHHCHFVGSDCERGGLNTPAEHAADASGMDVLGIPFAGPHCAGPYMAGDQTAPTNARMRNDLMGTPLKLLYYKEWFARSCTQIR